MSQLTSDNTEEEESLTREDYIKNKHRIQPLQSELGRICTICKKRIASYLIFYTFDNELMKRSTCSLKSCAQVCLDIPFKSPSPLLKPMQFEEQELIEEESGESEGLYQTSGDIRAISIPPLADSEPYETHFNGDSDLSKIESLCDAKMERLNHPDPTLWILIDKKAKSNKMPVNYHVKKECGVNCLNGFKWPHGGVIITRKDIDGRYISLTEPLSDWGKFFNPFKSNCAQCRLGLHNHKPPFVGKTY